MHYSNTLLLVCRVFPMSSLLFVSRFLFNEVLGSLFADSVDVADFVLELNSVALVCHFHQLRTECGGNELCVV